MQMLTLASSRSDSRAKRSCGVVGFGEVDAATGAQHPPGFAQHRQRIDQVLHHPHQPHPVEMAIGTGKLRGVAHHELHRFASQAGQMTAGGGDLLRVEVDAAEPRFGVGLSDLAEHRAHAAADLQQVFAGMELQVVGQERAQQIRLLHEPALFPFARAVDVGAAGHGGWGGGEGRRRPAGRSASVIGPAVLNRQRPVELLQQQQAGQLVGEGERREAEPPAGAGLEGRVEAIGAADHEGQPLRSRALQPLRQGLGCQQLSLLAEHHQPLLGPEFCKDRLRFPGRVCVAKLAHHQAR
jgi:hypothetical protein